MNFNSNQRRRIEVICKYNIVIGAIKRKHAETALEVKKRKAIQKNSKLPLESMELNQSFMEILVIYQEIKLERTSDKQNSRIISRKILWIKCFSFVEKLLEEIPDI